MTGRRPHFRRVLLRSVRLTRCQGFAGRRAALRGGTGAPDPATRRISASTLREVPYAGFTGPGRLVELLAAMGIPVRALLRRKGTPYHELKLEDPAWTDNQLIDFMGAHPILMNRPIVVTPLGTRLCRPSEAVLDLLPSTQRAPFAKEDGEPVVDAQGRRVSR